MPDLSAISSATSQVTGGLSQGSGLGQDTFLKLLTTQMMNQDPLSPMDNQQFLAQLASFSSVEQLVGLRSSIDAVNMGITSMNNASMANLLGADVVAYGDGVHVPESGDLTLHYDASTAATSSQVTVYDENGRIVDSFDAGPLKDGEGEITWDAIGTNGSRLPEGNYTFSISATDSSGAAVDVQTMVVGTIDEMDFSSGFPRPMVDGVPVNLGDVIRLETAEESA